MRIWNLPFLRNSVENTNEYRQVSWLELFCDLAFVVAIARGCAFVKRSMLALKTA